MAEQDLIVTEVPEISPVAESAVIVDPVAAALADAKTSAREQVNAVWQLQAERIQELLTQGWQEHLDRVFEERFEEVAQQLSVAVSEQRKQFDWKLDRALAEEEQAKRSAVEYAVQAALTAKEEELRTALENKEFEAQERVDQAYRRAQEALKDQVAATRRNTTRDLSERLNQAVRRVANAESLDHWRDALLDGVQPLAESVLLFRIAEDKENGAKAILEGARVPEFVQERLGRLMDVEVSLSDAPALESAVETRDTVVAVRSASELSELIASLAPETAGAKAYLFPIVVNEKVAAVLYAEEGEEFTVEPAALELMASVGSMSLAIRRAAAAQASAPAGLVGMTVAQSLSNGSPNGSATELGNLISSLSREEQELHLRAQRFARVQVAEMRLYKSNLVKQGRANQNLYSALREDIDLSREAYRVQFMNQGKNMVDYLHVELVRTLANDDAVLMGVEYPGPLAGVAVAPMAPPPVMAPAPQPVGVNAGAPSTQTTVIPPPPPPPPPTLINN